jgi:hypothetical protein
MMLFLNLGGRFLGMEISKDQELFFQHPWVRRILIFTVLFIATRNIIVAFWLTLIVVLVIGYLFNENSALCIFGSKGIQGSSCADKTNAPSMTPEEQEIFRRLNEKHHRIQAALGQTNGTNKSNESDMDKLRKGKHIDDEDDKELLNNSPEIYMTNISLLKNIH